MVPTTAPARAEGLARDPATLIKLKPHLERIKLAHIGNFTPQKCGIATFTGDLVRELGEHHPEIENTVIRLCDENDDSDHPDVSDCFDRCDAAEYGRIARELNASDTQLVWLQHEFGIFGGEDGEYVQELVRRLALPLIVTFHTVLSEPSAKQEAIMRFLIERSSGIMVMSQHGRRLLMERYDAPHERITVIEHGAPDRPFGRDAQFKASLGYGDRTVLTTFGLLGPGKGLETAIEALPAILAKHEHVLYRIVGATHPNLVAEHGESYREGLIARAQELGVEHAIEWDNRFLDTEELLDQLEACDIYLTPYPNMQQATSGTLSYAVALGKAVVSTPYVHASELLADGVGMLVPPGAPDRIAQSVCELLDTPGRLIEQKQAAYERGRITIWPQFARACAALVRKTAIQRNYDHSALVAHAPAWAGVDAMTDATGIAQHAIGIIPDRRHGYCIDDNARALMLSCERPRSDGSHSDVIAYAAFVQDAWNADRSRFRNFMGYDRTWLEDEGSDDSNGRALWALGWTASRSANPDLAEWAAALYDVAARQLHYPDTPRASAFTILAATERLAKMPGHDLSLGLIERAAPFLSRLLNDVALEQWFWFEDSLAYDNARLPQALIAAGRATGNSAWQRTGLAAADWLRSWEMQANHYRPVGSETFGNKAELLPYDQQPLEAAAAVDLANEAFAIDADAKWLDYGRAAYAWFLGANDRGVALGDPASGRCRDGLTPTGVNRNCGAESILAFHLAYHSLNRLESAAPARDKGEAIAGKDVERRTVGAS